MQSSSNDSSSDQYLTEKSFLNDLIHQSFKIDFKNDFGLI